MNTFADWLKYLENLNPHKIDLSLERVAKVAHDLQLIKFQCPVITVTGTNGKGSCVAILEAIYLAAGYRVGAYTSPHLFRFNERIRIQNQSIDDDSLCEAFTVIQEYLDKQKNISLTYFEFTTLAALKIFQQAQLDVLILEVGLGGRLDAVNVVDADVAVITTIDIDHTEWLGNTRASIGYEKAGIFRGGKAAVCGDFNAPQSIYTVAHQLKTRLYSMNKDFFYNESNFDWNWYHAEHVLSHLPKPSLELQNAATALMAIQLLQSRLLITSQTIAAGLQNVFLPGRFQIIGQCIFDVAHNPHAADLLAKRLQTIPNEGRTLGVVGMLANKDIHGTLNALKNCIDIWYSGGLDNPRGASGNILMKSFQALGIEKCYNHASVKEAYQQALLACQTSDRIVVFGSFYTVSMCLKTKLM